MRMMMKLCAVLPLSLAFCSLAAADDQIQAAVDNLTKSINASVARDVAQAQKTAEEARQNAGAATGDNVTAVSCTDEDGDVQTVKVKGLSKNTVIINCRTDEDGQPHIVVKGDGATREIGAVKVEGDTENTVIINKRQLGPGSEIVVEGKNAKAAVGNVEVKGGKLKNSTIVNNTVISGGKIEAKGEGASVSVGTVTIGGDDGK
jgi:hypothetical protein